MKLSWRDKTSNSAQLALIMIRTESLKTVLMLLKKILRLNLTLSSLSK